MRDNRRKNNNEALQEDKIGEAVEEVEKNSKKNNEVKGKELVGKEVTKVEHHTKAPVQARNKFALLEKGEIEQVKQIKKVVVCRAPLFSLRGE